VRKSTTVDDLEGPCVVNICRRCAAAAAAAAANDDCDDLGYTLIIGFLWDMKEQLTT